MKMEFGKFLESKGYTWKEDVRTDDFQHLQNETQVDNYRREPELGGTEAEYHFKVLKRHGVIVDKYLKR
jgi:hypothetical protein